MAMLRGSGAMAAEMGIMPNPRKTDGPASAAPRPASQLPPLSAPPQDATKARVRALMDPRGAPPPQAADLRRHPPKARGGLGRQLPSLSPLQPTIEDVIDRKVDDSVNEWLADRCPPVDLAKERQVDLLTKLKSPKFLWVGLAWEFAGDAAAAALQVCAFGLGADKKLHSDRDFVSPHSPCSRLDAVQHLVGGRKKDLENIKINLYRASQAGISEILVVAFLMAGTDLQMLGMCARNARDQGPNPGRQSGCMRASVVVCDSIGVSCHSRRGLETKTGKKSK